MWLPNHRLDGKEPRLRELTFHGHPEVPADDRRDVQRPPCRPAPYLAARIKTATDAAREAARTAQACAGDRGPRSIRSVRSFWRPTSEAAQRDVRALTAELTGPRCTGKRAAGTRHGSAAVTDAGARTGQRSNRPPSATGRSLLERLASLRGQYADDKRKLAFLRQAEQLFDPLHVTVCAACLSRLDRLASDCRRSLQPARHAFTGAEGRTAESGHGDCAGSRGR